RHILTFDLLPVNILCGINFQWRASNLTYCYLIDLTSSSILIIIDRRCFSLSSRVLSINWLVSKVNSSSSSQPTAFNSSLFCQRLFSNSFTSTYSQYASKNSCSFDQC